MPSLFPALFDYQQIGPIIIRLILAAIFIAQGFSKLFKTRGETAVFFNSTGIKPSKFWVIFVGLIEFLSGIMLATGFLTQLAATLIAIIMIVAILKVKIKQGFLGGCDFELLILTCALALLLLGPGNFSVDLPL